MVSRSARGGNGGGTMPHRCSKRGRGSTHPARSTRSPASNRSMRGSAGRNPEQQKLQRCRSSRASKLERMEGAADSPGAIRRVLIAGDTHGNTKWVRHLTEIAARDDCPVIIQVGDFGYLPDHRDGPRFLSTVDRACAANGVELCFIDGNHDDHTSLTELEHGHVPVRVAEHITYLPRGTRLGLGGCTFGFPGGAFSVDWRDRTAGIDWWPHEVTDSDDVARLGKEPLDVLIAHDAPACVDLLSSWRLPAEDQVCAPTTPGRWLLKQREALHRVCWSTVIGITATSPS